MPVRKLATPLTAAFAVLALLVPTGCGLPLRDTQEEITIPPFQWSRPGTSARRCVL